MLKLLFVIPILALLDPLLLIWIWPRLPSWGPVVGLIGLPLIVTLIARRKLGAQDSPFVGYLRNIPRLIAWYPGPISKVLALLLLIPAIERLFIQKVMGSVLGNVTDAQKEAIRATMRNPKGPPGGFKPVERDENGLKKSHGRVID